MKKPHIKPFILFLAIFTIFGTVAKAQYGNVDGEEEKYPKNVIRFNPASLILNNYSFFYERALKNNKISLQLGGNYMINNWSTGTTYNNTTYTGNLQNAGFGFTPEIRYYYLQDVTNGKYGRPAPYGLYLAGFGRYMRNNFTFNFKADNIDETMKFRTQIFAIGGLAGFQGIISKAVAIDIFIGPDINYASGRVTQLPDVKIFEGDEIDWADLNWITRQLLKRAAMPSVSTVFPGIRAGITAGVAF